MANQHEEYDDLEGVDLSTLDLDSVELDDEEPSRAGRWVAGIFLVGAIVAVLWLPSTNFYAQYGQSNWFFFTMCGVAVVFGLTGGRWLWAWAQEAAERYQARRREVPEEPEGPPSAFSRWATLLVAVGGGGVLVFWLPSSGYLSGTGGDGSWFFAAAGAVIVGILLGRWLLMQPARAEPLPARKPIVLPPWFKWVSLTVLLGGATTILGAGLVYGDNLPESVEFSLGGGALVFGVGAAIWLVRRFDETERKIREEALRRRRGSPETQR